MSKQLDGKTCQVCHAYLFEDDDIVVCPDCGAPYHRDCYQSAGGCALADRHGTDEQYSSEPPPGVWGYERRVRCDACGRETAADSAFCPYCGATLNGGADRRHTVFGNGGAQPSFAVFNPVEYDACGGVKKEAEIESGVTAGEAAAFVGARSIYYIPRFVINSRTAWNWAAFLAPSAWFAYRKMYRWLILSLVIVLASVVCMVPLFSEVVAAISAAPTDLYDLYPVVLQAVQGAPVTSVLLSLLSTGLWFAQAILCGLFGNRMYREHVMTEVRKAKEDGEGDTEALAKRGRVNFLLFLLILLVLYNADRLLMLLIQLF